MIPLIQDYDNFSVMEWHRLDNIAATHEREMRTAYLQTVVQGQPMNSLIINNVVTDCVIETGVTSAPIYGMVFNPNAPSYRRLIDALTEMYMDQVMNDESARGQVRNILPSGLSLSDRRNRLDTFGLDGRSAVRIERMRQEGEPDVNVKAERIRLAVQRGNLIALTETNRIVNATLETLWIENLQGIRKVNKKQNDSNWYYERGGKASVITSLSGIPKRARKTIVTRKDNRVCEYCEPLDGVQAHIGFEFNTKYGLFMAPPFHPRCRCFMIVRV